MAIVKSVKEKYPYEEDVRKLANYITNPLKCKSCIGGGKNIIFAESFICNPEDVVEQFLAIQYGQRFERRMYHVIINFDNILDRVNFRQAYYIGQAVCNMYPDYQSIFTIHEDKGTPHIHIMFNNCPIFPDKPKLTKVFNWVYIQEKVDSMIDQYLGVPL